MNEVPTLSGDAEGNTSDTGKARDLKASRGQRPQACTLTTRARTGRSHVLPEQWCDWIVLGSLRTLSNNERTWEVGQLCSICEVAEQGHRDQFGRDACGGDGEKTTGQRKSARANHRPNPESGTCAKCARADTRCS